MSGEARFVVAGTSDGTGELTLGAAVHPPTIPLQVAQPSIESSDQPGRFAGTRILVIGINYAPEPTGIAPYTTGMAQHLAASGASVQVITGLPHYPQWRVDRRYRRRSRIAEPRTDESAPHILRVPHYVPRKQTALRRALYEATFLASSFSACHRERPDLILAVTPSLGGAVAAARLAERHDIPLLVVVQDLMAKAAGQSGIAGGSLVADATSKLEQYALRRATRVAVVSESFRPSVIAYGVPDANIALLPNWTHITPAPQEQQAARQALGWKSDAFIVAHTGNIGLKQDLGSLVEAARYLPPGIEVLIIGEGSQRVAIERQAAGLSNVRLLGPLSEGQYPLALAAADLLLVNERAGVGDMSLPSKLTSYLSAGRPVLAAVDPDGATAAELARTQGASLVVRPGHPEVLAQAVVDLRDDAPLRTAMSRAGFDFAQVQLLSASSMEILDHMLGRLLHLRQPP
jgi:glycosyltransferase involved in cell wall biosynthesis